MSDKRATRKSLQKHRDSRARAVLLKEVDSGSQAGQGIPRQNHAYRGRTMQSEAGQCNPRQDKAIRGRTRQSEAGQGN